MSLSCFLSPSPRLWALSTSGESVNLTFPFCFGVLIFWVVLAQPGLSTHSSTQGYTRRPGHRPLAELIYRSIYRSRRSACRLLANQLESPIREASVLSCRQDVCASAVLPFAWLKYRRPGRWEWGGAGISTAGGAIGAQQHSAEVRLRQFRVFLYFFPQFIYQGGYVYTYMSSLHRRLCTWRAIYLPQPQNGISSGNSAAKNRGTGLRGTTLNLESAWNRLLKIVNILKTQLFFKSANSSHTYIHI